MGMGARSRFALAPATPAEALTLCLVSKVRKVQGTSVPAGGLGVPPRFKTPPLRIGEGDIGGEVEDF